MPKVRAGSAPYLFCNHATVQCYKQSALALSPTFGFLHGRAVTSEQADEEGRSEYVLHYGGRRREPPSCGSGISYSHERVYQTAQALRRRPTYTSAPSPVLRRSNVEGSGVVIGALPRLMLSMLYDVVAGSTVFSEIRSSSISIPEFWLS